MCALVSYTLHQGLNPLSGTSKDRQRIRKDLDRRGGGGDKVVSVLAYNSDDPSSNPAEAYSFYVNCRKRTK